MFATHFRLSICGICTSALSQLLRYAWRASSSYSNPLLIFILSHLIRLFVQKFMALAMSMPFSSGFNGPQSFVLAIERCLTSSSAMPSMDLSSAIALCRSESKSWVAYRVSSAYCSFFQCFFLSYFYFVCLSFLLAYLLVYQAFCLLKILLACSVAFLFECIFCVYASYGSFALMHAR